MNASTRRARWLGLAFALAYWLFTTAEGWLTMLCASLVLHGAAVAIRAAAFSC